ncbi:putative Ubiquitin-like domain superfamily, UBL3-like, ubiquitin domain-containing protein [Helianthus anomalus]
MKFLDEHMNYSLLTPMIWLCYVNASKSYHISHDSLKLVYLSVSHSIISEHKCNFSSDKKGGPKSANDIKLINAGKILENSKTVGQCRTPFGELPKGVITMHAVVQMSLNKAKTGNYIRFFSSMRMF